MSPPGSHSSGITSSNIIIGSSHSLPWTSSLSSPTFLPPRRRRRHHNNSFLFPNWTRLTDDDFHDISNDQNFNQEDMSNNSSSNNSNQEKSRIENDIESNSNKIMVAKTYTTPQSTSAAYNSGLLISNDNIFSSNSSSRRIRLAFRYYLDHSVADEEKSDDANTTGDADDNDDDDDEEEEDKLLYICWIRHDGTPCHFRELRPVSNIVGCTNNSNNDDGGGEEKTSSSSSQEPLSNKRLRGSKATSTAASEAAVVKETNEASSTETHDNNNSNNSKNDVLLVNENDMIENTFPGHAFVICRKMENYNLSKIDTDSGGDEKDDNATTTRVIQDDGNGCTVFLRQRNRQQSDRESSSSSDRSTTSSTSLSLEEHKEEGKQEDNEYIKQKEENNDDNDEWDAYLVVGGYRPGPTIPVNPNHDDTSSKSDDEEEKTGGEDEGKTHDSNSDDGGSDSDSDDDEELNVQLVIINRSRTLVPSSNNSHDEKGDDDEHEDAKMASLRGAAAQDNVMNDMKRDNDDDDNDINDDNESDYTYEDEDETEFSGFLIPVVPNSTLKKKQQHCYMDDCQVSVCMAKLDPTPVDMTSKQYDHVVLGGWPCRIQPGCFHTNSDNIPSLRDRFEADITAACQSLPPIARQKLQQTTPIWINSSHKWGPKVAPIIGRDACFHPGAQWLRRNGDNPLKCGGVEFYNAQHYLSGYDLWGPGGLILHELCHAWHNLHIDNGYDNHDIQECYNMAMNDGLYDCVRVHGLQGPECKAYACTNAMEYFAELSVAFLGGLDDTREHNKWYPFNRSQLREHDPRAFDMLCRMWGVATEDNNGGGDEEEEVDEVETYIERQSGENSKEG